MSTASQIQIRRNTAAGQAAFVGAAGELTADMTNLNLRLHDGTTAGGNVIPSRAYVDAQVAAIGASLAQNLFLWRNHF